MIKDKKVTFLILLEIQITAKIGIKNHKNYLDKKI